MLEVTSESGTQFIIEAVAVAPILKCSHFSVGFIATNSGAILFVRSLQVPDENLHGEDTRHTETRRLSSSVGVSV